MTQEEFTKLVEALKAQGMTEEDILGTLLEMFKSGKVSAEDLEKLAGSLGYELTEKFKSLASEGGEAPEEGEITEEEVEEAQEVKPEGEKESESDESEDEEEEESESVEEEEEESDESEDDEEEEKKEVRKLYGLDE